MSITIPILLLLFFALSFWLLSDSKVKNFWKIVAISSFFVFSIIFWFTSESILGYPAKIKSLPEVINIVGVKVEEPNQSLGIEGVVYLWLDYSPESNSLLFKMFGYNLDENKTIPRGIKLPYSRKLHEDLQENVMEKLKNGQIIRGKLLKSPIVITNIAGGSESLEQEYHFYTLPPSYFQNKNEN